VGFVDLLISFRHPCCHVDLYRFEPSCTFFLLPVFVLLAFLASLGPGPGHRSHVKIPRLSLHRPVHRPIWLYVLPWDSVSTVVPEKWVCFTRSPNVGVIDVFSLVRCAREESHCTCPGFSHESVCRRPVRLARASAYFRRTERSLPRDMI